MSKLLAVGKGRLAIESETDDAAHYRKKTEAR